MAGWLAWSLHRRERAALAPATAPAVIANPAVIEWADISEDVPIDLQIGYGLIGLVDDRTNAPLMTRITGIRRQLSQDCGFVIPIVRVRDEIMLDPQSYRICIAGVCKAEATIWADKLLAIDSPDRLATIDGTATRDPTYGLDAVWIDVAQRTEAVAAGYTVVDAATVVATHLNHVIQAGASELLGVDEAQKLVDVLKELAPQLVAALTPAPLPMPVIAAICRALLAENVPLRDFRRIAAAMVEAARGEADPALIVERVRERLGALIVQTICPWSAPLNVVTLDPSLEALLAQAVRAGPDARHPVEPGLASRLVEALVEGTASYVADERPFAIVTSPIARRALSRLVGTHLPGIAVLSFLEIPDEKAIEVLAVVGEAQQPALLEPASV